MTKTRCVNELESSLEVPTIKSNLNKRKIENSLVTPLIFLNLTGKVTADSGKTKT